MATVTQVMKKVTDKKQGITIEGDATNHLGFQALRDHVCWSAFKNDVELYLKNYGALVAGFGSVFVWILAGSSFYSIYYDWAFSAAMFYAAQAGLSVGFGGNLVESEDGSKVFSIFFVMAGSSFVVGALGLFVSMLIEKSEKSSIAAREEAKKDPRKFKKGHANSHAHEEKKSLCVRFCYNYRTNKTFYNSFIAFFLWILAGTLYGMLEEDWSLITSLYFSVAGLSTGGLEAPFQEVFEETWQMWFLAIWVLTGVPVYALALGQLAGIIIDKYQDRQLQKSISASLSKSEFEYAAKLAASEGDDFAIDFNEFLQFKLLRLGMMDQDFVDSIREQFNELDVNGDGSFSREEMNAALSFDDYDTDNSGFIEFEEFLELAQALGMPPDMEMLKTAYAALDSGGDGTVGRPEFVAWYLNSGSKEAQARRKNTLMKEVKGHSHSDNESPETPEHKSKTRSRSKGKGKSTEGQPEAEAHPLGIDDNQAADAGVYSILVQEEDEKQEEEAAPTANILAPRDDVMLAPITSSSSYHKSRVEPLPELR